MAQEIERKFLLSGEGWRDHVLSTDTIRQGYLSASNGITVRIRTINDGRGFITIKSGGQALERSEFEYPIPIGDARQLLMRCLGRLIEKRRHHLDLPDGDWVVDEFQGAHAGLVLLEVELPDIKAEFTHPAWLGEDVTGRTEYYNSTLANLPGRV
jgi:adenylate cyclase